MTVYCSFCGESQHNVRQIISAKDDSPPYICDECVVQCVGILFSKTNDDMITRLDKWINKEGNQI